MIYHLLRPLKLYRLFWWQLRANPADARRMVTALLAGNERVMKIDRLANLRGWLAGLAVRYVMGGYERRIYHTHGDGTAWPTWEQWQWLTHQYLRESDNLPHLLDMVGFVSDPLYKGQPVDGVANA